jgi:hypothetical protein
MKSSDRTLKIRQILRLDKRNDTFSIIQPIEKLDLIHEFIYTQLFTQLYGSYPYAQVIYIEQSQDRAQQWKKVQSKWPHVRK